MNLSRTLQQQLKSPEVSDALRKNHGGPGSDYGTEYEQRQYLRGPARFQREKLLKQFCKTETGLANSQAYREGWERIFGGKQ